MTYPSNLYVELRTWYRVRKVALEYEDQLSSMGFRVDWIGRIYTVINLPEEVITAAPQIQEGYVLMKLRDYDRLFLQLGLAGDVFPEMERITEEGVDAFLLILSPERDYFKFWPLIGFIIKTGALIILVRLLWVLGTNNLDLIIRVLEDIKNYLV
jgi:hypothetical protein